MGGSTEFHVATEVAGSTKDTKPAPLQGRDNTRDLLRGQEEALSLRGGNINEMGNGKFGKFSNEEEIHLNMIIKGVKTAMERDFPRAMGSL